MEKYKCLRCLSALNPQVVKEIVTDIMILISFYFLLDNIPRNIFVSRKVSLEEGLPHATGTRPWLPGSSPPLLLNQTLYSSIAVRISKSFTFYSVIRRKTGFLFERKLNSVWVWLVLVWSKHGSVMEFTFYRDCV